MIRVAALLGPAEQHWLRDFTAELGVKNAALDCDLAITERSDALAAVAEKHSAEILICDVLLPGALEQLRQVRRANAELLVLPVASAEIAPVQYVSPDILPYGLLWRPMESEANRTLLLRALRHIQNGSNEECFALKSRQETRRIPYGQILYFEAQDKKITLKLTSQELRFHETIAHLEQQLSAQFLRCHKSFLVNRRHIEAVDWTAQVIRMDDQSTVPISRTYRSRIKERLYELDG